jgi:hypothetical protein
MWVYGCEWMGMGVGEWVSMGVAVWMGWYLQIFLLEYESRTHRYPHTQERIRTMNKIIIGKLEKFPRVEPNFRFLHY